ncbi:MAG: cytochrome b/b6 domain-containing protein [Rhodocyclaceae bacterium]|jgi:cytochrome b|nr:cytochrome b/b6 domain-containing protein [Rhodocyclaceae bacterium]MBK6676549.1 cytochrome b/b6 domain-containing protein [Rhodocyclaceae bacterium]MBK9312604.1 cytochrome b/b6 domain-containing protein [Rhodocyclaceae bacterium]MBK9955743.1 cytochrome b/b6 domain-containing protein [Rhodocyclaceae bacterium]
MTATERNILVWDLPVRLGHWLMAGGFALAWLTGDSEEWRLVHVAAGGTVVGVALFRLLWGLVGTRYARFADFVRGPHAAIAYLKSLLGPRPAHCVGHNPAGAWAIVLLLALGLLTGAAGWLTYQEIGGELFEELHEGLASTMLAVVVVHLVGVAVGSLVHRENLPRTMITGRKIGATRDAIIGARPLAAMVLLGWVGALAWLLSR